MTAPAAAGMPAPDESLVLSGVSKSFRGVAAVRDCSFTIEPGCVSAIVGPNGAGKSTVFNLVTGFIVADAGRILYRGSDLVGLRPPQVFQRGVARSFQGVRTLRGLTVLENLLLARTAAQALPLVALPGRARRMEGEALRRAWEVLEELRIAAAANRPAGELGFAEQKLLSLGRLMMTDVRVLLLDEPLGGLDAGAIDSFVARIRDLVADGRRTVCVVEHNLDAVRRVADRTIFMANGQVAAAGRTDEVLGRADLTRLYLGLVAAGHRGDGES